MKEDNSINLQSVHAAIVYLLGRELQRLDKTTFEYRNVKMLFDDLFNATPPKDDIAFSWKASTLQMLVNLRVIDSIPSELRE